MSSLCPDPARGAIAALSIAFTVALLAACEREQRRFEAPAQQPERNAFDVNAGKRLFRWYNCNGCHGTGGGGSYGPALSDGRWRYGHTLDDVVATIRDGRPNGMPPFGGRVRDDQLRQLAAYVRSLSGQLHSDVAPARNDSIVTGEPESRRDREATRPDPAVPGARP
jgi:cytochrome c oxidase cbb3-type subunit 3